MASTVKPTIWCPGIVPVGHPLRTGLGGLWPLWAGSGPKAMDVSGNGKNGTLTNMPLATCWVPSAEGMSLDVITNDYVDTGIRAAGQQQTLAVWLIPDAIAAGIHGATGAPRLYIGAYDGSTMYLGCGDKNSGLAGPNTLVVGKLSMLAVTFDGSTARGYTDGIEFGTLTSVTWTGVGAANLTFGSLSGTYPFDGKLLGGAYWHRCLGQPELAYLTAHPDALITRDDSLEAWATATAGGAPPAGLSIPIAMRHYMRMMGAA